METFWVLVTDIMGQMNSSVCPVKLFIAGTCPKQTQQPVADISIFMDAENEEEKV